MLKADEVSESHPFVIDDLADIEHLSDDEIAWILLSLILRRRNLDEGSSEQDLKVILLRSILLFLFEPIINFDEFEKNEIEEEVLKVVSARIKFYKKQHHQDHPKQLLLPFALTLEHLDTEALLAILLDRLRCQYERDLTVDLMEKDLFYSVLILIRLFDTVCLDSSPWQHHLTIEEIIQEAHKRHS